jgi:2-polyprenyl-3-methyl-5-hydroxy-6-metoxy-1,4-benzoquinol methylase
MATWNKDIEASYFRRIPQDALEQSLSKPFSQSDRGGLLVEIGIVISLLPEPPARILDLGCGTGWTSAFLARCGFEVVGVDFSPEAILAATSAHQIPGLTFLAHDWDEALSPGLGPFDATVFFDALHHSDNELGPLRTAWLALRAGGICITCEPGTGHAGSTSSIHARSTFGVNERDMTPTQVMAAGREVGFAVKSVYPHPQEVYRSAYAQRTNVTLRDRLLSTRIGYVIRVLRTVTIQKRHWGIVVLTK